MATFLGPSVWVAQRAVHDRRPVRALAAVPPATPPKPPRALSPAASSTPPRPAGVRAVSPPRLPVALPKAGLPAAAVAAAPATVSLQTAASSPVAGRDTAASPASSSSQHALLETTPERPRPPRVAPPAAPPPVPPPPEDASESTLLEYSKEIAQKLAAAQAEVLRLREERDSFEAENTVIGEYIFGLQKENGKLQDMGRSSQLEKQQLTKQAEGQSVETKELRTNVQRLNQRVQALTAENGKLGQKVAALSAERTQLAQNSKSLEVTLESLQAELLQRLGREAQLEQRSADLGRELELMRAQKGHADVMIHSLHLDVARLQQVASELEKEKAQCHELKAKLDTADREIARCYQEKAELDQLVSSLHVEAAQAKTKLDSALCEVPQLHGSLQQHGARMTDLQNQVVHLSRDLHEAQGAGASVERQAKALRAELEGERRDRARAEKALAGMQVEIAQLRQALDGLTAGKAESDRILNSTLAEKGVVHSHFEEANARMEQLQKQVQQANVENVALKARLTGLEQVVRNCRDEAWNAQDQLRLAKHEKEQLEERMQQWQSLSQGQRYPTAPLPNAPGGLAL